MVTYSFNRHEKLKSKKLTELLFKEGKSFHSFPFRVAYIFHETAFGIPASKGFVPGFPVQFGISVSTRNFKKAVSRNRIKRQSREAWRLHKQECYAIALQENKQLAVFFIFTQKTIPDFAEIEKGIVNGIKKLNSILQQKSANPVGE